MMMNLLCTISRIGSAAVFAALLATGTSALAQRISPASPALGASSAPAAPVQPVATGLPAGTSGPAVTNVVTPPQTSDVFGMNLFTGAFAREGAAYFNPDYVLTSGDTVQVRLWGAYEHSATLAIDPQGNIFLPLVGPVALQGVRNKDLQPAIEAAVRRIFRNNVNSYATLAAAQPVRVFVGGFVQRPGLYSGTSMDDP